MDLKENTCLSALIEIGWKRQKSVINCQPEYGIHHEQGIHIDLRGPCRTHGSKMDPLILLGSTNLTMVQQYRMHGST